jgi:hypothetical protein
MFVAHECAENWGFCAGDELRRYPKFLLLVSCWQNFGGKKLVRRVGLPGVAWFAVCQDSEGNNVAIFRPDPSAR